MEPWSLEGQWALVTGASKGIGLGIARTLAMAGANLVLVARGAEVLSAAGEELRAAVEPTQTILTRTADTADRRAIAELFDWIEREIPILNVLVANAGTGRLVPFLEVDAEEWDSTLALNLTGTFLCCQRAARLMVEAPTDSNRSIIVASSIRAHGVRPGLAAYAATKAAVNQLVRVAAYELAPRGVRVNALSPGITATPLALEENPEIFAERTKTVPMGRAGTPEDMAAAALFLASPAASFVTGANVVVDGGESLW
jgi:glucose 1-dehydrogenase